MILTPTQRKVRDLVESLTARRGYPPTITELSEELGIARGTVFYALERLRRKGVLTKEPGLARTLRLVK